MDETELVTLLEKLAVDDAHTVAAYVNGVVEANGCDRPVLRETLEPFVPDETKLDELCDEICAHHSATTRSEGDVKEDSSAGLTEQIKARWTQPKEAVPETDQEEVKPQRKIGLDAEARAATLRLAQQLHEKHLEEEIASELAAKTEESEGEALAAGNRAAVQRRITQAQAARAAAEKQHREKSKEAALKDKKEKAEKKEARRNKAIKGERRGGG